MSKEKCPECKRLLGTGERIGMPCYLCRNVSRTRVDYIELISKEKYDALRNQLVQRDKELTQAKEENRKLLKPRTCHDGDCTIYASIIEGKHIEYTDGICTCGYGWECVRHGDWSKMFSKARNAAEAAQKGKVNEMSKKWKIGFDPAKGEDKPCLVIADSSYPEEHGLHIRHISHSWEQTATQLAFVMGDLARLQAIVDKLPKTADGVPVCVGDVIWYRAPGIINEELCTGQGRIILCEIASIDKKLLGGNGLTLRFHGSLLAGDILPMECYSTLAAAEAGKDKS